MNAEGITLRALHRLRGKQRLEAGVAYARQLRAEDPTGGPATLRMRLRRVFTQAEVSDILQASV